MIRAANLLDVPWILEQAREFDQFYKTKIPAFSPDDEEASKILEHLITDQVFLIASDVNGRMGFICGVLRQADLNPTTLILIELAWWVAKDFRGSTAGARLLKAFIDFGRENEADWVSMRLLPQTQVDPRSLERQGFALKESQWLLELVA